MCASEAQTCIYPVETSAAAELQLKQSATPLGGILGTRAELGDKRSRCVPFSAICSRAAIRPEAEVSCGFQPVCPSAGPSERFGSRLPEDVGQGCAGRN
jgi:hypothetical protein